MAVDDELGETKEEGGAVPEDEDPCLLENDGGSISKDSSSDSVGYDLDDVRRELSRV